MFTRYVQKIYYYNVKFLLKNVFNNSNFRCYIKNSIIWFSNAIRLAKFGHSSVENAPDFDFH